MAVVGMRQVVLVSSISALPALRSELTEESLPLFYGEACIIVVALPSKLKWRFAVNVLGREVLSSARNFLE